MSEGGKEGRRERGKERGKEGGREGRRGHYIEDVGNGTKKKNEQALCTTNYIPIV